MVMLDGAVIIPEGVVVVFVGSDEEITRSVVVSVDTEDLLVVGLGDVMLLAVVSSGAVVVCSADLMDVAAGWADSSNDDSACVFA
jgi:hypothetical protein